MQLLDKLGAFLDACKNNRKAELAGYIVILVGLVGALGPWVIVSVAGLYWLNEVVDG